MTNIRFRRGAKVELPLSAPSGMPLWCEDTKELFVGTSSGVQKIGSEINSSVPIGTVLPWTSIKIPDGYLECNGQAISRTDFSELFGIIGTTFGTGNGNSTFNIPDLRAEFIRGFDNGRNIDTGRILGSLQSDDFKSHTHRVIPESYKAFSGLGGGGGGRGWYGSGYPGDTGATGGAETRPRNIALVYIIKAKNITGNDSSVQNANADTLDGLHSSAFSLATHNHLSEYTTLFEVNGYTKLPNGLILQWGTASCGSGSAESFNFALTFPNNCLGVWISEKRSSGGGTVDLYLQNYTKSGFTAANFDTGSIIWIAIGY